MMVRCGYDDAHPETGDESKDNTAGHRHHAKKGFWFRYATTLVEFPIQTCIIILMLTIVCGALTYIVHGVPSFEEPRKGFETRGTEVGKRLTSLTNLWRGQSGLSLLPRNRSGDGREVRSERSARDASDEACPIPGTNMLKIVFEAKKDTDTIGASHLISICRQEEKLLREHPEFTERCVKSGGTCCPSWSLGHAVALMNNRSSCMNISEDDVESTQQVLDRCRDPYLSGLLEQPDETRSIPPECKKDNLVYTILHYLTPSDPNGTNPMLSFSPISLCFEEEDEVECEDSLKAIYQDNFDGSLDDGISRVTAVDFNLKFALFDQFLVSDFLYVLLGALSAFVIIWLYTHSVFVTTCAILNMIMSLVMAAFIYFVILRLNFFPFVNVISAVLVIGIGADDTFVYMDLYREAHKTLGGTNDRVLVFEEACRHAFSTMFVTSFTTSSALFVTMLSDITAIKCFAAYAGSAILINFIYTITWLPAVLVIHDKYFTIKASTLESYSESGWYRCITKTYHSPNRFFEVFLPKLIWTLRFLFILLFLAIGVCGFVLSFITPGLGLPESDEFQLFRTDHLFEQYDQVYRNQFAFDQSDKPLMPIFFIWGVTAEDTGNYWDPDDTGKLHFDPSFDISSNVSQRWLNDFCAKVKEQPFIDNSTSGHFCFIDSFRLWMSRPCRESDDPRCCQRSTFPFPKVEFDYCVKPYWEFSCPGRCDSHLSPGLRFDPSGRVQVLYLAFQSSIYYSLKYTPINNFWNNLSSWTEGEMEAAPDGLKEGWSVSLVDIQLYFYDLQAGIASGTATSVALSLAMATVVLLLSTRNILTTVIAMLTISLAVFTLIGVLVLLGWELNVFESAILSLAVGLSVDFTIHYGVAFRLAPFHKRKDRAVYAIRTLSSAITVAAISTFAAGAFMLPATVINYVQLGTFLTLVMSISWLFSNFFFLPLCMVIGPSHNCGQLPTVHCDENQSQDQETPANPDDSKSERDAATAGVAATNIPPGDPVAVKVVGNDSSRSDGERPEMSEDAGQPESGLNGASVKGVDNTAYEADTSFEMRSRSGTPSAKTHEAWGPSEDKDNATGGMNKPTNNAENTDSEYDSSKNVAVSGVIPHTAPLGPQGSSENAESSRGEAGDPADSGVTNNAYEPDNDIDTESSTSVATVKEIPNASRNSSRSEHDTVSISDSSDDTDTEQKDGKDAEATNGESQERLAQGKNEKKHPGFDIPNRVPDETEHFPNEI